MRKCKYNCKTEGPPGPIWCIVCGHAPSCCNCDEIYEPRKENHANRQPSEPEAAAEEDHDTYDPDFAV
jgi:hypothetical protein